VEDALTVYVMAILLKGVNHRTGVDSARNDITPAFVSKEWHRTPIP